jgi:hypothetical protein
MWPVIQRASVPPTEMSKDHRPPHHFISGVIPLFAEWSAVPVHSRCLTDRHRQRDLMIAGSHRPVLGATYQCIVLTWEIPVRRRTRVAQALSTGAGPFERNGPAPYSVLLCFLLLGRHPVQRLGSSATHRELVTGRTWVRPEEHPAH